MSWRDRFALWQAKWIKKPMLALLTVPWLLRPVFALSIRATNRVPKGVQIRHSTLRGVPCTEFTPPQREPGALLLLHGGGFVMGGSVSYAPLAGRIATRTRRRVFLTDYWLAPERPFPHAARNALAAYKGLLAEHPEADIALLGDSAGGNLVLSLLHQIAAEDLPAPRAMVLLSPAADLSPEAEADLTARPPDQILPERWGRWSRNAYLADNDGRDPLASPLRAPFALAPPTLIHYAQGERLAGQAEAVADALRAAGGKVEIRSFAGAYHAFQIDGHPMARRALDQIGRFVDAQLAP